MSSWFDKVTGTNDYERQSWRDSYNGGRAAGDFTGGVNARLDQERRDYGGATWSGSSSEYSALEHARNQTAPVTAVAQAEQRGVAEAGPKAAVASVATRNDNAPAAMSARAVTTKQLVQSVFAGGAFGSVLANKPTDLAIGGGDWRANPYYSDAEDVETRHGDVGSALYAPISIGVDIGHNAARMYFGNDYMKLSPSQRLTILGNDASEAVKSGFLGAVFGGYDSLQGWATDNRARERAGAKAAADFDAAWDYREQEQARQGLRIGDGARSGGL